MNARRVPVADRMMAVVCRIAACLFDSTMWGGREKAKGEWDGDGIAPGEAAEHPEERGARARGGDEFRRPEQGSHRRGGAGRRGRGHDPDRLWPAVADGH